MMNTILVQLSATWAHELCSDIVSWYPTWATLRIFKLAMESGASFIFFAQFHPKRFYWALFRVWLEGFGIGKIG